MAIDARRTAKTTEGRAVLQARLRRGDVELALVPGAGHFEVIDPAHPSCRVDRDWITGRLSG